MGTIRIGCSGWVYKDWRGVLYPPGLPQRRWLARYAEVFDTVEVNSTFYRLAREEAVAGWAAATPPEFLFTMKASRFLTHVRRLRDMETGVERFETPLRPLGARRGPTLWQLPPDFRRDDERLRSWLDRLPPGRHAIEFRHPSWYEEDVLDALRWHSVGLAVGDDPRRVSPPLIMTATFGIVRLHYGTRGRRGNYSDTELAEWAARLTALAEGGDLFVYLNNDWEGFAVRNALRLKRLLTP